MIAIDDLLRGIFVHHPKRAHKPGDLDLTLGQLDCMRLIDHMGSPSMSELSTALDLQPSTVTGLIDALVERGLVTRQEDPTDRRIVRVRLTNVGRQRKAKHRQAMRRYMMELLGDIADEDLRRIYDALCVLHSAAVRRAERMANEASGPERDQHECE
ncbi:MAG: MarR family transcriptional regulator [Candidatus Zipacnadales bacterium]